MLLKLTMMSKLRSTNKKISNRYNIEVLEVNETEPNKVTHTMQMKIRSFLAAEMKWNDVLSYTGV